MCKNKEKQLLRGVLFRSEGLNRPQHGNYRKRTRTHAAHQAALESDLAKPFS